MKNGRRTDRRRKKRMNKWEKRQMKRTKERKKRGGWRGNVAAASNNKDNKLIGKGRMKERRRRAMISGVGSNRDNRRGDAAGELLLFPVTAPSPLPTQGNPPPSPTLLVISSGKPIQGKSN